MKSKTNKRKTKALAGSLQRRVRLSDVVKAARDAGAEVPVSLQPKETIYWQVAYRSKYGTLHSGSVTSQLGAVGWVANLLDNDAENISVMRGVIKPTA
jgi:hypothetical protein